MKWLDLFSGVGMYARGLEQAGHEVIGFCEVDSFCQKILKKHWPTKPTSWCVKSLNTALTELLVASPVKIFHSLAGAKGFNGTPPLTPSPVQDSSGKWLNPICWFDLDSCSWKTWQRCLFEGWAPFLGPWPAAGQTSNGIAWAREPLAHPIIGPASTFLPTPLASEYKGTSRNRFKGSPNFRSSKMSEGLRTCHSDPIYTSPQFAEAAMGLPKDFTQLETATPPASSANLQEA